MSAYSIYISSTYKDLIEERGLLRAYLDRAQYVTVCMEKYPPASPENIKVRCQGDVCKADMYVAIIGDTYGSIALDENGKELGISYTEYEYDAAVESKKKRFVFFKTLKEPPKDERLISFITKIKKSALLTANFDDIKELPAQVMSSIIAATKDYLPNFIPSETKYLCDRSDQFQGFHDALLKKLTNQIHYFMLSGHRYNGHANFVKRCIYAIKTMFNNQETLDVTVMANSSPPSDENKVAEELRKKVLRQLEQKVKEPVSEFSADCFFECLQKSNKLCLVISIIIQSTFLKNHTDVYKKAFQRFYDEFSQKENPAYQDKKIIFFIDVQYVEEAGNEKDIVEDFENEPHFVGLRLPTLNMINDSLIMDWIQENDIEHNQMEIDTRIKDFFASIARDANDQYFMDSAEGPMEKLIDFYNQQK